MRLDELDSQFLAFVHTAANEYCERITENDSIVAYMENIELVLKQRGFEFDEPLQIV